jgi:hypothetical protein
MPHEIKARRFIGLTPKPTRYGRAPSGPLQQSAVCYSLPIFSNILIGTLRAFDSPPLRLMTLGDPNDRTVPACIRASVDRDRQNTLAPAAYIAQYCVGSGPIRSRNEDPDAPGFKEITNRVFGLLVRGVILVVGQNPHKRFRRAQFRRHFLP